MPTTKEPVFSASSPPYIFDSEMIGPRDTDPQFDDFFDSSLEGVGSSPGFFLAEDIATDTSQFLSFGTPNPTNQKSHLLDHSSPLDRGAQPSLSAPSTASPAGSYRDSSSESSGYKRKSSSDSSRSALTSGDVMMADTDMRDWKAEEPMLGNDMSNYGVFEGTGTINPAEMSNYEFSDKTMENDFDFESAASSPSLFGLGPAGSPEMTIVKQDAPRKQSPMLKSKLLKHDKRNSQHSVTQSMNGLTTANSREASPLSAMVTSQESSPSAFFNNSPSPGSHVDFMNSRMLGGSVQNPGWVAGFGGFPNNGLPIMPQGLPQQMPPRLIPQASFTHSGPPFKPAMTLHPTPLKSRVETQIPIKMTLFPMPVGITKLHLPTHTISKPKLLAKPSPARSPDTLELYTSLVCTSAMQNPEARRRAFERAASGEPLISDEASPGESGSDEDDENRPLNGGDVKICVGCITRERKRAARKKVKKVEEEESWHKDEAKRVIVFNTHEVKEWQPPSSQPPSEATGDRPEPFVPDGAMQVDAPMRIACYCRHQNEKLGFQVIFTIKDFQDRLVAQEMTSSIMITDDHKTHNMPTLTAQNSDGSERHMLSGPGAFTADPTFDMASVPPANLGAFRGSHSSSDLQGTQSQNTNMAFPPSQSATASSMVSQATSATTTPRNLSRQTSPSVQMGPSSKKRKASGSSKVPSGLAMTRLETGDTLSLQGPPTGPLSASNSAVPSPFTRNLSAFAMPEQQFNPGPTTMPSIPQQYNTGPPTPNSNDQILFSNQNRSQSMDNLAMQQLYSAPASAHPSRVPSPNNGMRNNIPQAYQHPGHIAQAVANGLYGLPLNLNPHRQPTIHKMIPNEGPKAGGIEVTCLGSGFCQGLEVMFGDSKATTTTYWGDTSLVCLLPPSAFAGTVAVTFKHQHQQQPMQPYPSPPVPKNQTFFKYVDDDEQQIIRTALSVLGHKMTGKMEDVRDLARRIVGDGPSSWGGSAGPSPTGGNHNQNINGFNMATFGVDVEATLLKCLDLIDLDDSPRQARLNMRRASGQTMLHLACSMGLHRFVAGLLARGASPDPRDKGGFTPMHFAALHNHPQIVRRLMLSGADPTIRSLKGYTPSDMATSEEVLHAARRIEHHTRNRSGSSLRSRTNSATSLRSLWEPYSSAAPADLDEDSDDDDNEYEDEDADAAHDGAFWMKSRRPSAQKPSPHELPVINNPTMDMSGVVPGLASPTAAMAAFRDHIAAQVQQFQHTMHLNLPNLPQMPRFDMINLPHYQAYLQTTPMVRRISNLVGTNTSRPGSPKEQENRWWDLFSGTVPAAPPAYEDIFPQEEVDKKHALAIQTAAETVAANRSPEVVEQAESSTVAQSRIVKLDTVRIGQKNIVTREQQDQLRAKHAETVKRLSRDRNLFFIWIPMLVLIVMAMLYDRLPQAWSGASQVIELIRNRHNLQRGRIVEEL
ncbi:related to SPT23-suppressor of TY retrotransposon [Rhynchosporium agropyri]|uniref:Related to SPT23-suppressor of TY retrotransposon n=1 Tax=Rhynchosporium agropyri TaxID=914238 RepID=A0A1E1LAD5_9HELO|nr:related to SPT23-suppressor of TY retrotransposon [Rhynchosporium agropyri]